MPKRNFSRVVVFFFFDQDPFFSSTRPGKKVVTSYCLCNMSSQTVAASTQCGKEAFFRHHFYVHYFQDRVSITTTFSVWKTQNSDLSKLHKINIRFSHCSTHLIRSYVVPTRASPNQDLVSAKKVFFLPKIMHLESPKSISAKNYLYFYLRTISISVEGR